MGPKGKNKDLNMYNDQIPQYLKSTLIELKTKSLHEKKDIFNRMRLSNTVKDITLKVLNLNTPERLYFNTDETTIGFNFYNDLTKMLNVPRSSHEMSIVAWKENEAPVIVKYEGSAIATMPIVMETDFSGIVFDTEYEPIDDVVPIQGTKYKKGKDAASNRTFIMRGDVLKFKFLKTEVSVADKIIKVESYHKYKTSPVQFISFYPTNNITEFYSFDEGTKLLFTTETTHIISSALQIVANLKDWNRVFRYLLQHNSLSVIFNHFFYELSQADLIENIRTDLDPVDIDNVPKLVQTFFFHSYDDEYQQKNESLVFITFLKLVYNFYDSCLKTLLKSASSVSTINVSKRIVKIKKFYEDYIEGTEKYFPYMEKLKLIFKDSGLGMFISNQKEVYGHFCKYDNPNSSQLLSLLLSLQAYSDSSSDKDGINALSDIYKLKNKRATSVFQNLSIEREIQGFILEIDKNKQIVLDVEKNYNYSKSKDDAVNHVYDTLLASCNKARDETLEKFKKRYPGKYKEYIDEIKKSEAKFDSRASEIPKPGNIWESLPGTKKDNQGNIVEFEGVRSYSQDNNIPVQGIRSYSQQNNLNLQEDQNVDEGQQIQQDRRGLAQFIKPRNPNKTNATNKPLSSEFSQHLNNPRYSDNPRNLGNKRNANKPS